METLVLKKYFEKSETGQDGKTKESYVALIKDLPLDEKISFIKDLLTKDVLLVDEEAAINLSLFFKLSSSKFENTYFNGVAEFLEIKLNLKDEISSFRKTLGELAANVMLTNTDEEKYCDLYSPYWLQYSILLHLGLSNSLRLIDKFEASSARRIRGSETLFITWCCELLNNKHIGLSATEALGG